MISVKAKKEKKERVSQSFSVSSFCTVATEQVQREAFIMLLSVRKLYGDIPFVIVCDNKASLYFQSKDLKNVTIIEKELSVPDSVIKRNDYHRSDAILWKMDSMEKAIELHGDSCFLDADIILLEKLDGPTDCSVALSMNIAEIGNDIVKSATLDGMFNAGMVWASTIDFPKWWRSKYLILGRKSFYEQGCLNFVCGNFRTGYFNLLHNYGFWRGDLGERDVKSFHCHMDNRLDDSMPEFMKSLVFDLRGKIKKRLRQRDKDLHEIVNKVISNEL